MPTSPYAPGDELVMNVMTQTDGEELLAFPVTSCDVRDTDGPFRWLVTWSHGASLHSAAVDDNGRDRSGAIRPGRGR